MADRVLITGGAGFIGSRLARRFAEAGHPVVVLDTLSPQVHGEDPESSPLVASLRDVATLIRGSVCSFADLRSAAEGADIVVHLAAETGTGQSMYEIDRYTEANVGGTAKLLQVLGEDGSTPRRLVIASSRSIYGEGAYRTSDGRLVYPPHRADADMARGDFEVHLAGEDTIVSVPTDEDAILHPSSVYGITKHAQESLVMTVAPTLGIEPVTLRYQNVYGPGQSLTNPYTGILSIFSTLIRQGKEINVFEDGAETRDFVFIDDVVTATFLASTVDEAAGAVLNVGSGVGTTVHDVVAALFEAFGRTVPTRISGNYRLGDIRHNVADITRLQDRLGFVPGVSFRDGVRRFVEWVEGEPVHEDAYDSSLREMASRNLLK